MAASGMSREVTGFVRSVSNTSSTLVGWFRTGRSTPTFWARFSGQGMLLAIAESLCAHRPH